MSAYVYTCVYAYVCEYTRVYACIYTWVHVYMCVHMCVYMCVYVDTQKTWKVAFPKNFASPHHWPDEDAESWREYNIFTQGSFYFGEGLERAGKSQLT